MRILLGHGGCVASPGAAEGNSVALRVRQATLLSNPGCRIKGALRPGVRRARSRPLRGGPSRASRGRESPGKTRRRTGRRTRKQAWVAEREGAREKKVRGRAEDAPSSIRGRAGAGRRERPRKP